VSCLAQSTPTLQEYGPPGRSEPVSPLRNESLGMFDLGSSAIDSEKKGCFVRSLKCCRFVVRASQNNTNVQQYLYT
jgi:hypothetical protein